MAPKPVPSHGSVIDHVALSYTSVDAQLKLLEGSGATVLQPARMIPGLYRTAFIQDPWGVKIELVEDPSSLGFHHTHLRAVDPEAMLRWFADRIGGERGKMNGRVDGLRYDRIWLLVERADTEPAVGGGNAIDHIGWRTTDLTAKIAELRSKGVTTGEPRQDRLVATTYATFLENTPADRMELTDR